MSKHTTGPWRQNEFGTIKTADGKTLITDGIVLGGMSTHETRANARLIAASPDMLAVLKELQESAAYWSEYDVPIGIVDRINQAIAKAEQS